MHYMCLAVVVLALPEICFGPKVQAENVDKARRRAPVRAPKPLKNIRVLDHLIKFENGTETDQPAKATFKVGQRFDCIVTFRSKDPKDGQIGVSVWIVHVDAKGRKVVADSGGSLPEEVEPGVYRAGGKGLRVHPRSYRPAGTYLLKAFNANGIMFEKKIKMTR